MANHPRFEEARKAFEKAGRDTATRTSQKTCGDQGCLAKGLYVETWRGTHYSLKGVCEKGHKAERYGYSERPVID